VNQTTGDGGDRPSYPIEKILEGGEAWLRMLGQAGVTHLPAAETAARDAWLEVIEGPDTESARPPAAPSDPGSSSGSAGSPLAGIRAAVEHGGESQDTAGESSRPQRTGEPSRRSSAAKVEATVDATAGAATTGQNPGQPYSQVQAQVEIPLAEMPDLPDEQRERELQVLDERVRSCPLCPELVANRTRTVFGVGNIRPRLVLMGEAPGADEDRLGEPMVGAAGQLLDKIIAAMKLQRQDVYILNSVKCRPPQNRNPTDSECGNCRPYWERQLEILRPECVVCLGAVASKTLLQTTQPVGRLRGRFHDYRGIRVVVTYHPAYLLRAESAKKQTWEDMKMVMQLLDIPV